MSREKVNEALDRVVDSQARVVEARNGVTRLEAEAADLQRQADEARAAAEGAVEQVRECESLVDQAYDDLKALNVSREKVDAFVAARADIMVSAGIDEASMPQETKGRRKPRRGRGDAAQDTQRDGQQAASEPAQGGDADVRQAAPGPVAAVGDGVAPGGGHGGDAPPEARVPPAGEPIRANLVGTPEPPSPAVQASRGTEVAAEEASLPRVEAPSVEAPSDGGVAAEGRGAAHPVASGVGAADALDVSSVPAGEDRFDTVPLHDDVAQDDEMVLGRSPDWYEARNVPDPEDMVEEAPATPEPPRAPDPAPVAAAQQRPAARASAPRGRIAAPAEPTGRGAGPVPEFLKGAPRDQGAGSGDEGGLPF